MNLYHLEVITHNGIFPRVVEADQMINNSDGFYKFSKRIENKQHRAMGYNHYETTACYPIVNTIIEKIEYNINQ